MPNDNKGSHMTQYQKVDATKACQSGLQQVSILGGDNSIQYLLVPRGRLHSPLRA